MTVSTIANLRSDTIFSEPKWSRSKGSRRHAHRALAANRRYARRFVFLDDRQRVAQLLKPLAPPQERGLNQVGPIAAAPHLRLVWPQWQGAGTETFARWLLSSLRYRSAQLLGWHEGALNGPA